MTVRVEFVANAEFGEALDGARPSRMRQITADEMREFLDAGIPGDASVVTRSDGATVYVQGKWSR